MGYGLGYLWKGLSQSYKNPGILHVTTARPSPPVQACRSPRNIAKIMDHPGCEKKPTLLEQYLNVYSPTPPVLRKDSKNMSQGYVMPQSKQKQVWNKTVAYQMRICYFSS